MKSLNTFPWTNLKPPLVSLETFFPLLKDLSYFRNPGTFHKNCHSRSIVSYILSPAAFSTAMKEITFLSFTSCGKNGNYDSIY